MNKAHILTKAQIYSKKIEVKNISQFNWEFEQEIWNDSIKKMEVQNVKIKNIEAIYINPKWRTSQVGEFLTFDKD